MKQKSGNKNKDRQELKMSRAILGKDRRDIV